MVKINLLPHREQRRKERTTAFYALLVFFILAGGALVFLVGVVFSTQIANQQALNAFLTDENKHLDNQIKDIATLKEEIESLKARQQAVEDLQGDRNQPVYLMDELVKQVPEGIYLSGFKQAGQRVELKGYAQSNERVSQLLRNVSNNSKWLEKPELVEISAASIGTAKDAKRVFQFTLNVGIKRPNDMADPAVPLGPDGKPLPASTAATALAAPAVAAAPGTVAAPMTPTTIATPVPVATATPAAPASPTAKPAAPATVVAPVTPATPATPAAIKKQP
jgi:type IV pilus assembly protein PilN